MKPLIGVLTVRRLKNILQEQIQAMNLPIDFYFFDMVLRDNASLPKEFGDVDVFLTSGFNAHSLKTRVKKPIVIFRSVSTTSEGHQYRG